MALVPRKPSMAVRYHRFCLRIRQSLFRNGAQNLQHLKILLLLFSTTKSENTENDDKQKTGDGKLEEVCCSSSYVQSTIYITGH